MLYALDLYSYIYINYFSLKLEKNKNKKIKFQKMKFKNAQNPIKHTKVTVEKNVRKN